MKKAKLLVLSIMCLGLLLVPQLVNAKEITVENTDKIQDIINDEATEAGDVLLLQDGTYQGDLTINKDLTLKGSDPTKVIIEGGVTISGNVTLENVTVEAAQEQLVDIAGKENGTVNITNCNIRYKDYVENEDYGKAYWTYGIRLNKTANGTTLNVTNSKIDAQYAIWVHGEKNNVTIDQSEVTGWAALDISNGSSAKETANDNVVSVTNSKLIGISYQAVNPTNGYGTIVIGGQTGLELLIQDSEVSNAITTANPLNLIMFGDAYLASSKVTIAIDNSKLINNDKSGNSYVYNYGTEEMASPVSENMIMTTPTTTITAEEGTINAEVAGYINLTLTTFDGSAIMKVPTGLVMPQPEDPNVDGYTFDGWYQDADYKTVFDFTQPLNQDTTIYAKYTKIEETPTPEPTPGQGEEENPSTSDINMPVLLSIGGLSLVGFVITVKKRLDRNHA